MNLSVRITVAVVSMLAAALLAPGLASADKDKEKSKDYCITFGSPGETFVGKDFKIPKPGQCKPWNGFLVTTFSNVSIGTGTGCTSSDGATFRLHLSMARENSSFQEYIVLPLPSEAGGTLYEYLTGQSGLGPSFVAPGVMEGGPCDEKKVPVP